MNDFMKENYMKTGCEDRLQLDNDAHTSKSRVNIVYLFFIISFSGLH